MSGYRLDGKTAVVTGGGAGIGAAIAEVFADAGAFVVVAGRRRDKLEDVARRAGGLAMECDVTRAGEVETLFKRAAERNGGVQVLVNNAGMPGPIANVTDVDLDAFRACVETNLFGALHCLQVAAQMMTAAGEGSIINMSSLMGLKGKAMRAAYSASKFALIGMTEAVAQEVGPAGVRVNALCPGAVSGELMDQVLARRAAAEGRTVDDITAEQYTDVACLRRWVDPREVADLALFLASDSSSAITGEQIKVDCGRF